MVHFFSRIFVFALALGLAGASTASAQDLDAPLSASERAQLERGETVLRRTTQRRGRLRLLGGTSFQIIDLPPEAVWRAFQDDADHIRRMLPQAHAAHETGRTGTIRTIHFEHEVGPVSASYSLRFLYDANNRTVSFQLDPGDRGPLRAGWGYIRIRSYTGDRTLVSYGALVDVGEGLVTRAMRPTLHTWVLKVPWTMRHYLHGSGRRRYVRGEAHASR